MWLQSLVRNSFTCSLLGITALFTKEKRQSTVLYHNLEGVAFHRIRLVGVGRDLCGSSSPGPYWSRVTQSRLHRTLSRRVLNISREGESTTPLGNLFQSSVTLRGKKFFLMFSWNFLCFSLCPLPLVLSLGTTEKSLAPSSWHPPWRYL